MVGVMVAAAVAVASLVVVAAVVVVGRWWQVVAQTKYLVQIKLKIIYL